MSSFFRNCAILIISLCLVLPVAPAKAASDQETVTAVIKEFLDNVSTNNVAGMTTAFAAEVSISDEFPPYYWNGKDAFAQWGKDFMADSTTHKVTEPAMTFGTVTQARVTGDNAYVVAPGTYAYKADGKPMLTNGLFTFTLHRSGESWKITSMIWTIN